MSNKIVNIVNFVRGVEPRFEEFDLYTPIVEEIKLNKKYGFENTFLLQYDAMMRQDIVDLFIQEKDEKMELGIWIEMARCLVEKAGIPWNSKQGWDWDWYVNPGFLLAYSKEEKRRIIDLIMEKFHSLFGYYPRSAGSWMLDTDSIDYMVQKYNVDAFCICREQWGTDAYTLWGGYYNGPYYPSKNHVLHPAQSRENQIDSPVIRILGPDPIYCFFEKRPDYSGIDSGLFTMEPAWDCGQSSEWVKWYFRNFIENEDMGLSYTQVGQENSFGWERIQKGLPMQMEILDQLVKAGKVCVEKMCDTGARFKTQFAMTPATVYSALDDWNDTGKQSVWYNCKNYRVNMYCDEYGVWIRDLHMFNENYRDVYLDHPCKSDYAILDTLPIMDGFRFSDEKTRAGYYFGKGHIDKIWSCGDVFCVLIEADGKKITVEISEERINMRCNVDFTVKFSFKKGCGQITEISKRKMTLRHNGMEYGVLMEHGNIEDDSFVSMKGEISFSLIS